MLVNIADPATGETALHIACRAGHENVAFLLIGTASPTHAGSELNLTTLTLFGFDRQTERNGDVNAHDKQHRTPLELIAETNHTFATDFKGTVTPHFLSLDVF